MVVLENIEFLRKKDYKYVKEIGQGGTGRTILIRDEEIDAVFVCKKYSTYYPEQQEIFYSYFIGEIKILHTLYHKNVVRVFNYHLYQQFKTGYILMEYIEGDTIEKYLSENPDKFESITLQLIEGFKYLEENKVLHRDIRVENILVAKDGTVKIIDFGFGKAVEYQEPENSISLNWPYSVPDEFKKKQYNFCTELYFVGKLLESIKYSLAKTDFKYDKILQKMISKDPGMRTQSFFDVYREILSHDSLDYGFTDYEKTVYRNFANEVMAIPANIDTSCKLNSDIDVIIRSLEELYSNSLLEEKVQNNNKLMNIFLNGRYRYHTGKKMSVQTLLFGLRMLKVAPENKRKVILNNLWERFDAIPRLAGFDADDLPF